MIEFSRGTDPPARSRIVHYKHNTKEARPRKEKFREKLLQALCLCFLRTRVQLDVRREERATCGTGSRGSSISIGRLRPIGIVVFKFSLANKLLFEVRCEEEESRYRLRSTFPSFKGDRSRTEMNATPRYLDRHLRFFVHFYQYVRYTYSIMEYNTFFLIDDDFIASKPFRSRPSFASHFPPSLFRMNEDLIATTEPPLRR